MTGFKNSRIPSSGSTYSSGSSPSSSSSSSCSTKSTTKKSTTKTKKKNVGKYETLVIKIAPEWEPLLQTVVNSYCCACCSYNNTNDIENDEQQQQQHTVIGQSGYVYSALKLYKAKERSLTQQPCLLIDRRCKSTVYAPQAIKCWFFVWSNKPIQSTSGTTMDASSSSSSSCSAERPDTTQLFSCSVDKTTKSFYRQDQLVLHCTIHACKIGWVFKYDDGLYIHIISGLETIEGIVENQGKVKESSKYSYVGTYKPGILLDTQNPPTLLDIYPNYQHFDASTLIGGLNLDNRITDDKIKELAQHIWKRSSSFNESMFQQFRQGILDLVEEINFKQTQLVILEQGYDTDEQV